MIRLMLPLACLLTVNMAFAADVAVIEVRRNIPLAEDESVYKDFYISGGVDSGLKKNLVVTAVRKINIRDASGANSFGEIQIPVGQLKIIAVYDKIAVAREFTLLSRDELPMLEQIGIMTGDRIDIKGSFIDTSKPKKKKVSALEAATQVLVTTTKSLESTLTPLLPTAVPQTAGPAPASISALPPETTAVLSAAPEVNSEKLDKVGDSGNNSTHE